MGVFANDQVRATDFLFPSQAGAYLDEAFRDLAVSDGRLSSAAVFRGDHFPGCCPADVDHERLAASCPGLRFVTAVSSTCVVYEAGGVGPPIELPLRDGSSVAADGVFLVTEVQVDDADGRALRRAVMLADRVGGACPEASLEMTVERAEAEETFARVRCREQRARCSALAASTRSRCRNLVALGGATSTTRCRLHADEERYPDAA